MKDRQQLQESWERTRDYLGHAAGLLPANPSESPDGGRMDRYQEWMAHNELELRSMN